jgi:acyl carrier protein
MKEEVRDLIIERLAVVFNIDASELSGDTHFQNDLKAKSAQMVKVTTFLEDEYDVEIPYMEFKRKVTVDQAAEFIELLVEG